MINDYNEFCDYIEKIYNKDPKLNESVYINRMINIFARKFTFPFLDEDDPTTFKNDFYSLIKPEYENKTKNFKKRLKFSTSAIKYLYTGIYDNAMTSEDKFFKYLKKDLENVPYGLELLEKYQNGEKGYDPNNLVNWKIYNANRDASFTGPLRMRIGVKYTVEEFNMMYDLALRAEGKNLEKDLKGNVTRITLMLMSYYYFYKSKKPCKYVPFILETMKTWYTISGHTWFGLKTEKHSLGFQGTHLLSIENKLLEKDNGMYATNNELTDKINPEIITLDVKHNKTYLTDDNKYVVFVDEGQGTFESLKKILPEIRKKIK